MVRALPPKHKHVGSSPSVSFSICFCLCLTDSADRVRWLYSWSIFNLHKRDHVTQGNVETVFGNGQILDLNSDKVWTSPVATGHRYSVLNVSVRYNWG